MNIVVRTRKINNQKITPFWNKYNSKFPVRKEHSLICDTPYLNICMPAKKGKGKTTTALNMIIKNFMTKNTKLVIFSPSIENDKNNKDAIDYIRNKYNKKKKKKNINDSDSNESIDDENLYNDHVVTYKEFINDKKNNFLIEKQEAQEQHNLEETGPYSYPKTIFYFDDLSKKDFKSEEIGHFSQNILHHSAIAFYSSQDWINFEPRIRKNLDILLLWDGIPTDRLKKIYTDIQPNIKYDTFIDFYHKATEKPNNFFFINLTNGEYRKNINEELYIPDNKI